jgi:anti-sigma regulatory factor (Ser/Thr protein kinase)
MPGDAFCHELLHYTDGVDGFVAATLPYIQRALEQAEPVLVAARGDGVAPLREELGDDAERVDFIDMAALGRNPARIIPAWREFLQQQCGGGAHALGIGEPIWPGRTVAELVECQRHEELLNLAFAGGQAWQLVCPYDLDGLDDEVIEAARLSHPFVSDECGWRHNPGCTCLDEPPRPFAGELPPPHGRVDERAFTGGENLADVRAFVCGWASEEHLEMELTDRLVLATNELATNSVRYGGGTGSVRVWREQDTLLCEVRDAGVIEEPLVGRRLPTETETSGRGLWLVNQLCDLTQIRSSRAGTTVRMHMRC